MGANFFSNKSFFIPTNFNLGTYKIVCIFTTVSSANSGHGAGLVRSDISKYIMIRDVQLHSITSHVMYETHLSTATFLRSLGQNCLLSFGD